jgi:hypothetical protein
MKVTRLRAGVRIHCSDSEMAALRRMTELGAPLLAGKENRANSEDLPGMAKAALRSSRFGQPGGPLATVDEDRR